MNSRPPLVDQYGNIHVHELEDVVVSLTPGEGVSDLSNRTLHFVITDAGVRVALQADAENPTGRLLLVKASMLRNVPNRSKFAVIDSTDGTSRVRWSGTLERYS